MRGSERDFCSSVNTNTLLSITVGAHSAGVNESHENMKENTFDQSINKYANNTYVNPI